MKPSPAQVQVLEVYPYATLTRLSTHDPRLAPHQTDEDDTAFAARVVAGLSDRDLDLGDVPISNVHAVDALIAAYTGWLSPDGLQAPQPDFNVASGWIWLPKPTPAA